MSRRIFRTALVGAAFLSLSARAAAQAEASIDIRGTPALVEAGQTFAPSVRVLVEDAGGNPLPGIAVDLALETTPERLLGTTLRTTGENGIAVFDDLAIQVVGLYRLIASVGILTDTSEEIEIGPGPIDSFTVVAGQNASAAAGQDFGTELKASAADAYGNPAVGALVTFRAPESGSLVTFMGASTAQVSVDELGFATAPVMKAGTLAGDVNVTLDAGAEPPNATFLLTILPDTAEHLVFVGQPSDAVAGDTIASFDVQLRDTFDNEVTTAGEAITLTLAPVSPSGPGYLLSGTTAAVTDSTGTATFADLSVNRSGSYRLHASAGAIASAQSDPFTIASGTATVLSAVSGTPQSATAAHPFASEFVVQALDAFDNPVEGVDVAFTAPPTGPTATLLAPSGSTDADGLRSTGAVAGTMVGSYEVIASASGLTDVSFALQNLVGAPSLLTVTTQPSDSTAGSLVGGPPTVQVTDDHGHPIDGLSVTVQLLGSATTLIGTTTRSTDAEGDAVFDDLSIDVAGGYRLHFMAASLTEDSSTFEILAAPAAALFKSGDQQSAAATSTFAPLSVRIEDAYGNPVPDVDVTFTAPTTGPLLTFLGLDTFTETTRADGEAATPGGVAGEAVGDFTIDVVAGSLSDTFTLSVLPGEAERLTFTQQPMDHAADSPFDVSLQVQDAFGNNVAVEGSTITLSVMPAVTFGGTTTLATDASGRASFASLSIVAAGVFQLFASGDGLDTAASDPFSITAAAPAELLAADSQSLSATAGQPLSTPLAVIVLDAYGNPVPLAIVDFASSAIGMIEVALSSAAATSGLDGVALVMANAPALAGSYEVTASVGTAAPVIFSLTVMPDAPDRLAFLSQPTDTVAGVPIEPSPVVVATDMHGNPIPGVTISFSILAEGLNWAATTGTDGQAALAAAVVYSAGLWELEAQLDALTEVSSPFRVTAATAASVSVVSGDGLSALADEPFAAPLVVRVEDTHGNPVSGEEVTFTAPTTGPRVLFTSAESVAATTDMSGEANSPIPVAGPEQGSLSVVASIGQGASATLTLNVIAATAARLAFVTSPADGTVGEPFDAVVEVQDAFGNPTPESAGAEVSIALEIESPNSRNEDAALSGTVTAIVDVAGTATFSGLSVQRPGAFRLMATADDLASNHSDTFTLDVGEPASLEVVSGTPQSAIVLTAFPRPLQVAVRDALDNGVTGVVVDFDAPGTEPSASLSAASDTTDIDGLASVDATAGSAAGAFVVAASSGALAPVDFSLAALTAGVSELTFTAQPVDTTAGVAIAPAVSVHAQDLLGNPVHDLTVTLTLEEADELLGTTTAVTDAAGGAEFSDLVVEHAGTHHLVASAQGVHRTSDAFFINAAAADSIEALAGMEQSAAAGTAFATALQAQVKDAFDNPVPGEAVTFTSPANATFASPDPVSTGADGVATASELTAGETPGGITATASTEGLSAYFSLTIVASDAHRLAYVAAPSSGTAGVVLGAFHVQVQDAFGNTAASLDQSISLRLEWTEHGGPDDPTLSGTSARSTDASGLAVFDDLLVNRPGTYTLTATADGLASAESDPFQISVGAPAKLLLVSGDSQQTMIQTAFANPLVVEVQDAEQNPIPGALVTFDAPASGATAVFDISSGLTDDEGRMTVSATANTMAGAYTVTADSSGLTPVSFTLENMPGDPASIQIIDQPGSAVTTP